MSDQPLPAAPRRIEPAATFEAIVSWIGEKAVQERAPGLLVGISGTDSILTFLACAKAFERQNRQHRVLGLNFEHGKHNELVEGKIICAKTEFNWVARDILPWLKSRAPKAQFEIDDTIPRSDDNIRWGHLFSRAVRDTDPRAGLSGNHYFVVGTRNATEAALGNYSQISRNVSMQPIIDLYKSEVLEICDYLGVPQIAIDKSREVDCDCGRFETQAHYMREVDLFLMYKAGLLSKDYVRESMSDKIYGQVVSFYLEETRSNAFRELTPYKPEKPLAVTL